MEIGAYMGQTEKWPNIGPITMNLDETKWDRIPPMSRTFLEGSGGRRGPNWVIFFVAGNEDPRIVAQLTFHYYPYF